MSATRSSKFGRKGSLQQAGALLRSQIRTASAGRGFSESKVLTDWPEIAGPELASITRPVQVSHARGGLGATLLLLTAGAHAPMVEMQKEALRKRVNTVYGYNAISRIKITQTAPTGFAEGQVEFGLRKAPAAPKGPSEVAKAQAVDKASDVSDPGLRAALERLGAHILTKTHS